MHGKKRKYTNTTNTKKPKAKNQKTELKNPEDHPYPELLLGLPDELLEILLQSAGSEMDMLIMASALCLTCKHLNDRIQVLAFWRIHYENLMSPGSLVAQHQVHYFKDKLKQNVVLQPFHEYGPKLRYYSKYLIQGNHYDYKPKNSYMELIGHSLLQGDLAAIQSTITSQELKIRGVSYVRPDVYGRYWDAVLGDCEYAALMTGNLEEEIRQPILDYFWKQLPPIEKDTYAAMILNQVDFLRQNSMVRGDFNYYVKDMIFSTACKFGHMKLMEAFSSIQAVFADDPLLRLMNALSGLFRKPVTKAKIKIIERYADIYNVAFVMLFLAIRYGESDAAVFLIEKQMRVLYEDYEKRFNYEWSGLKSLLHYAVLFDSDPSFIRYVYEKLKFRFKYLLTQQDSSLYGFISSNSNMLSFDEAWVYFGEDRGPIFQWRARTGDPILYPRYDTLRKMGFDNHRLSRRMSILKFLLESGADPNYITPDGETALLAAVSDPTYIYDTRKFGEPVLASILRLLATNNQEINNRQKWLNAQPFIKRFFSCLVFLNSDYVSSLLKVLFEFGFNINAKTQDGDTTYQLLRKNHNTPKVLPLLSLLINFGYDVHARNKVGDTFLHIELLKFDASLPILQLLRKNNLNPTLKNQNGIAPIDMVYRISDKKRREKVRNVLEAWIKEKDWDQVEPEKTSEVAERTGIARNTITIWSSAQPERSQEYTYPTSCAPGQ